MEKNLQDFPSIVTLNKTKKIIEQMENCICKIYTKEGKEGTGFFCYLVDPINKDNKIPVLMTNNHIIGEDYFNENATIKLNINNGKFSKDIKLDSKRKKYTNKNYDVTIIEIMKGKDKIDSFLEIDDRIFQNDSYKIFDKSSTYIIQYPNKYEVAVSYGVIKSICEDNNYNSKLLHYCLTNEGSSGSPILEIENNKVLGIHLGSSNKNYNIGTFLKNPIISFFSNFNNVKNNISINDKNEEIIINNNSVYINNNYSYIQNRNEISLTLNIGLEDINKEIYFLDNTNEYIEKNDNKKPHSNLQELNKENTELIIDDIKYDFQKFFIPPTEGEYTIKLKFKNFMKDCSYMFFFCQNIISIDFSLFKTKNVINMSNMFCHCKNLKELDLSSFNTENVRDMSKMFSFCVNLVKVNLTSFNIKNVIDMKKMFVLCNKLNYIDISSFITSQKINTDLMFDRCWNLNKLKINKKSYLIFKNALKNIGDINIEFSD